MVIDRSVTVLTAYFLATYYLSSLMVEYALPPKITRRAFIRWEPSRAAYPLTVT
jgi:hypothetical protein